MNHTLLNRIFKVSIVSISLVMFINFLFTACVGMYKTFHALSGIYFDGIEGRPGLEIVESLDLFLVALLFLILSLSIMKLFYPQFAWFNSIVLPWLKIDDFFQLKQLTWNAFLLTLLITFGTHVIKMNGQLEWTMLIVPVAVLLFSVSAKFLRH